METKGIHASLIKSADSEIDDQSELVGSCSWSLQDNIVLILLFMGNFRACSDPWARPLTSGVPLPGCLFILSSLSAHLHQWLLALCLSRQTSRGWYDKP